MPETVEINEQLGILQQELTKLHSAVEYINKAKDAAAQAVESSQKVANAAHGLAQATGQLVKKIDQIDFPSRLEKLDNTVSGINQGVQNALARIETLERHVSAEIQKASEGTNTEIKKAKESVELKLDDTQAALQSSIMTNKRFIIISWVISLAILLLILLGKIGLI